MRTVLSRSRGALALTASVAVAAALALPTPASAGTPTARSCAGLTGTRLVVLGDTDVVVQTATDVPAVGAVPQHCVVTALVGGRIHAQVSLPTRTWVGRYVQVGGGGYCGTIPTAGSGADTYLARGVATASDDTGHTGSPGSASWADGRERAARDWGFRSEHLTAAAGKAVVRAFYGASPARSYFIGCSTGGRQALMEAQRYPDDFDGIVAGAPANRQSRLAPLAQGSRELANRDAQGRIVLTAAKAAVVADAVMQRCDDDDGVVDGVLNDPRTCDFRIGSLACPDGTDAADCLTAAQLGVLREWYDSARTTSGRELYPGGEPAGSEGGWPVAAIGTDDAYSFSGGFGEEYLKYLAFAEDPPASYGLDDFDPATEAASLRPGSWAYDADDPDLTAYHRSGGKLLLYHGLADPLIPPYATIQYYEDGLQAMGGLAQVQPWYRMFLLPGVYHCSGGPGPDQVDLYAVLDDWVVRGSAPDRLLASKRDGSVTRPLYPYPQQASYQGGDPSQATSFGPVVGPRGRDVALRGIVG